MSWPLVKLGDVAKLINGDRGKNYPSKGSFVDKGIPFINAGCLSNEHTLIDAELNFITEEKFDSLRSGKIEKGDILFCLRGSLGKFALVDTNMKGAIASSLVIIRANEKVYIDYLKHYLGSFLCQREIQAYENGAAQPNLSATDLKSFQIPLPPLEEQKRIAAVLDKADAIRQKRKQAIDLADDFLRSVFLDMFGDPVTNSKGWEIKTVKECLEAKIILDVQDGNHGNSHPKVSDFSSEGIPFLAANVIRKGKVLFDSCYYLSSEWLDKLRIGFAKPRDVLLSHKGTLGLTAVLDSTYDDYIFSPQTTYYRLDERTLMPEYLKGYFDTQSFQTLLEKEGKQSTRAYIGITRQKELPIMLPPMEEQLKFFKLVSSYNQWYAKLNSTDVFLKESFNSLSQKAFSGQL
jgi:type I restriction enzyme S subunit